MYAEDRREFSARFTVGMSMYSACTDSRGQKDGRLSQCAQTG